MSETSPTVSHDWSEGAEFMRAAIEEYLNGLVEIAEEDDRPIVAAAHRRTLSYVKNIRPFR